MSAAQFPERTRVDAFDKVRGVTAYTADLQFPRLLYAMMVPSPIAKGTMTALPLDGARRVRGVVRILTPADFPAPSSRPAGEHQPPPPATLESRIAYRGQPVALVLAETLEAAIEGAETIRPTFTPEPFAAAIDSPGMTREAAEEEIIGNAARAFAGATIVEATYQSSAQHHNAIELLTTIAVWADGRLTIYEASQNSGGIKAAVAQALRLDPAIVDVKSATLGGGFGQKGGVQRQTVLVARAAMLMRRPVKLVTPRAQAFHLATFRPHSRHRLRLGGDTTGKLVAVQYDAEHQQSRTGFFPVVDYHETPIRMYAISNYHGTAADLRLDTQAPGWMRTPHAHESCFALESAVDELAYKLGRDPVDLRVANDAQVDPKGGHPFSSRFLNECLAEGARRFGWDRRTPAPGSMTAADGTQIGWGVAAGAFPGLMTPAIARLRIGANGATRFAVSGHEMGQGMRTAIAAVLLQGLQIDPDKLEILVGDTTAAPQHQTGGSWGSASAVPVAAEAATQMRTAVDKLLAGRRITGNVHQQLAAVRRPFLQVEVSSLAPGQDASALQTLRRGGLAIAGPEYPDYTTMSYVAHFVEVHVEPRTRRIRMPRVVSIVDCGRVISPRTARSQVYGGVVWGFGAALREGTEVDPRYGGFLNNDLADYVVPVNADIGDIEVGFIDRPDPKANALGLKGIGQVTMVGVAAAIANAIYHATGRRLRKLPIRVEDLL